MIGTRIVSYYVGRWLWVPAFAGTTKSKEPANNFSYTPSATTM
jgi:hypothetical protein